ncbi:MULTISPECIES: hypothetical protein [Legionella]|uniref:Uncharacterized protein n=1 Tax=Legionella waltersii TaxID=66969 RepID=A0A0W1ALE9_9GAMM|nr:MULTISPECIES: hypothetical protein [Legionella]KTD82080.1 hypothetical protein Lwal_0985 [Legionella waltersii]MCZ4800610.1 hypothetical protein [Legionella pneumophila]SNU96040.1 Uncharacterised protein [Legionella waltersii]
MKKKRELIREFRVFNKKNEWVDLKEYAIFIDVGTLTNNAPKYIRTQTEYVTHDGLHYYLANGGYEFNGIIFKEKE